MQKKFFFEKFNFVARIKEAPYSWFSLKHFLYRSESSRDSRVESSRSGEIFKNYI